MTRLVLTIAFVAAVACKGAESAPAGPTLTPVVANQLRSLAADCTVRKAASGRTREMRMCTGRQSQVNIHLDAQKRLVKLEVAVYAALRDEAAQLMEIALRGVVPDALLAELKPRLNRTNDSIKDGGVELQFRTTKQDNENPRYAINLLW